MERRAFLAGLLGVAGVAAFAGAAQALPLARKTDLPGQSSAPADGASSGGTTPDGTPIEKAQVVVRVGPRRRWRRRYYARRYYRPRFYRRRYYRRRLYRRRW